MDALKLKLCRPVGPMITVIAACLLSAYPVGRAIAQSSAAQSNVYTVAKYPIEAEAKDAVTAKRLALADGRTRALKALFKRIVPVTAYKRLRRLKITKAETLIDGIVVRNEQNSATEYLASMDFSFNPDRVREMLTRQGLPYVDRQANQLVLIPIFRPASANNGQTQDLTSSASGQRDWRKAWSSLDLRNTVTPVRLMALKPIIREDIVNQLVRGDFNAYRVLSEEYEGARIVLAHATPDAQGRKLHVTLSGQDSVGPLHLTRVYRIEDNDLLYTGELAAIIGLGVLEGRWKAANGGDSLSNVASEGSGGLIDLTVIFSGLGQWQAIRQRLASIPGLSNMNVGIVSARGAELSLSYPGGIEALGRSVVARGLFLSNQNGVWVLQPG